MSESIFDKSVEELADARRMIREGSDILGEACVRYVDLRRKNERMAEEIERLEARVKDLENANSSSSCPSDGSARRTEERALRAFALWLDGINGPMKVRVRGEEGGAPYDREVSLSDAVTDFLAELKEYPQ